MGVHREGRLDRDTGCVPDPGQPRVLPPGPAGWRQGSPAARRQLPARGRGTLQCRADAPSLLCYVRTRSPYHDRHERLEPVTSSSQRRIVTGLLVRPVPAGWIAAVGAFAGRVSPPLDRVVVVRVHQYPGVGVCLLAVRVSANHCQPHLIVPHCADRHKPRAVAPLDTGVWKADRRTGHGALQAQ